MGLGRICSFEELKGKTFTRIDGDLHNDSITFYCSDGSIYKQYHSQDCCEDVTIEDIIGSFDDLLDMPVLLAEEVYDEGLPPRENSYEPESYTWTFYKLATNRGYVTIRWYGESNGYYSETAQLWCLKESD